MIESWLLRESNPSDSPMHKTLPLFMLSIVFTGPAAAVDSTFNGSGSWDSASSWTPSGVPNGAGHNVTLPANSNVNGLGNDVSVDAFQTGGNVTFSFGGSGKAVTVTDTFQHASGTLQLQANMGIVIADTATATMAGTLAMSNGAAMLNRGATVFGSGSAPTLDFTPVASSFTAGTYSFRNDGAVAFTSGTQLSINNLAVINTGRFIIEGAGTSPLLQSYTQNQDSAKNLTVVKAGSTLHANTLTITRGDLYSSGVINGSTTILADNGDGVFLSPGDAPLAVASLTFQGNPGQISGSTWHFDLGGIAAGTQHDYISAWQNMNVNGVILDVSLVNGFVPAATDAFTIVGANNVNGLFGNATDSKIEVPGFGVFDVTVGSNKVVLSNFTAAVPEPSHVCLLLGAMLVLLPRRRRSPN